jgi:hypothetical protein
MIKVSFVCDNKEQADRLILIIENFFELEEYNKDD